MSFPPSSEQYPVQGLDLDPTPKHVARNSDTRYSHVFYSEQNTNPPFLVELPAPLPPAPHTSTPAEQLDEDQKLARKLQRLEVAEAQVLKQRASQVSLNRNAPPLLTSQHCIPQRTRPYSFSTSQYGPEYYAQATRLQLSPSAPADLAPEVHILSPPASPSAVAPELVEAFPPEIVTRLPPAPADPALLSRYLEKHRQVPYPPQWILPPIIETLYGAFLVPPKSEWPNTVESQSWYPSRCNRAPLSHIDPAFTFLFKSSNGIPMIRDPGLCWTMSPSQPPKPTSLKLLGHKNAWAYNLRYNHTTSVRTHETLTTPDGKSVVCTYVHARNYDSLRFHGRNGTQFRWVTQGPVSTVNGARFDTLRHALFMSTDSTQDPLYGQIVADHTYWDGHADRKEVHEDVRCRGCDAFPLIGLRWRCKNCAHHDVCEGCRIANSSVTAGCDMALVSLPDEALYIRSESVERELVVATLQIMKDWEKIILRNEARACPAAFAAAVERARTSELGRASYWKSSDFEGPGVVDAVQGALLTPKHVTGYSGGRKRSGSNRSRRSLDRVVFEK